MRPGGGVAERVARGLGRGRGQAGWGEAGARESCRLPALPAAWAQPGPASSRRRLTRPAPAQPSCHGNLSPHVLRLSSLSYRITTSHLALILRRPGRRLRMPEDARARASAHPAQPVGESVRKGGYAVGLRRGNGSSRPRGMTCSKSAQCGAHPLRGHRAWPAGAMRGSCGGLAGVLRGPCEGLVGAAVAPACPQQLWSSKMAAPTPYSSSRHP